MTKTKLKKVFCEKKKKYILMKFPYASDDRNQYQLRFLLEIAKLWAKHKDERWDQLMFNYLLDSHYEKCKYQPYRIDDPFYTEDSVYLRHIKKLNK